MSFAPKPLVIIEDTLTIPDISTSDISTSDISTSDISDKIPEGLVHLCIESRETGEKEMVLGMLIDKKTVVYIATYQPSFPYGHVDISRYGDYRESIFIGDGYHKCPYCTGVTYHSEYGICKCSSCSVNYRVEKNFRKEKHIQKRKCGN